MKKTVLFGFSCMALVLCLFWMLPGNSNPLRHNSYKAESVLAAEPGIPVIEELSFTDDSVTMRSGELEQTAGYSLDEKAGEFILQTDFGDFPYSFQLMDTGFILDGILYMQIDA